jgi:hypothetical protein
MLAGGFGDPPTEMAHYNYGVHPILGWIAKSLFLINNQFNWYSLLLIAAHYVSCTVILTMVIRRKNILLAYLSYAVLFLVFEGHFMLFMDFTASSAVLGIAALLYLLVHAWERNLGLRQCIITAFLFLFASFYRIHSILPLLGIALPFFVLTVTKKEKWRSLIVVLASAIIVLSFNFIHRTWYTAKKADWPQEEAYRQSVYRFFNEASTMKVPAEGEKWYKEYSLVTKGMLMETSLLPVNRIDSMYHDLKKEGKVHWQVSSNWLKWFYINNRLFFAVLFFFVLLYGWRRKVMAPALLSILLLILGFYFLLIKYKGPTYILVSSMMLISYALLLYNHEQYILQKKLRVGAMIILLFLVAWSIVRLDRTSKQNINFNWMFKIRYAEIAEHPKILFVGANGSYSNKFYVFDVPSKYPFHNYLHAESFLTGNYKFIIKRFGIEDLKGILPSHDVLIRGNISPEQKAYFEQIYGQDIEFSDVSRLLRLTLSTWQITPKLLPTDSLPPLP